MNRFWNAVVKAAGGPVTEEELDATLDAAKRQFSEPPSGCAHIHPMSELRRLRAAGETTTRCWTCGALLRVS